MNKPAVFIPMLAIALTAASACDLPLDLEPDRPPGSAPDASPPGTPPDASPPGTPPDGGLAGPLPPPEPFPSEPVITLPDQPPSEAPPPEDSVASGVHIAFPPPVGLTPARSVTVRGTARLPGGITAVRVNGVDAWLSQPNARGAVHWRARLVPALGANDIVVEGVDGDGNTAPGTARASLAFAPELLLDPTHMVMDPAHDRVFVSDRGGRSIVALELDTGAATLVSDGRVGDRLIIPGPLALDVARGSAVALFERGKAVYEYDGSVHIDLADLTSGIQTDGFPHRTECEDACREEPHMGVALDAARGRFFILAGDRSSDVPRVEILEQELGTDSPLPESIPLCDGPGCWARDLIGDRRSSAEGFAMLALVLDDASWEVRTIDPATRTQESLVTVQTTWPDGEITPRALALDAGGDRLFVLASADDGIAHVIRIDLASGGQSRVYSGAATTGGVEVRAARDLAYDSRRDRLLLLGAGIGLIAVDLDTGVATQSFFPTIGQGPTLGCDYCVLSSMDRARERFFIGSVDDIFQVDLATGDRRLVSESGRDGIDLTGFYIFADEQQDRLLVLGGDDLYTVDVATGARAHHLALAGTGQPAATWDPERNRILYVTSSGDLREVDLAAGTDEVISSDTVGGGPSLSSATSMSVDATGARAFVLHGYLQPSIRPVDLATGVRVTYPLLGAFESPYGPVSWSGPALPDVRRNRVLVGQSPANTIGAIDLTTTEVGIAVDGNVHGPGRLIPSAFRPDYRNDRALVLDDRRDVQMLDLQTGERVLITRSIW